MAPKIACSTCGKIISKSNISYHRKRCNPSKEKRTTTEATMECKNCNMAITKSHMARHHKICGGGSSQWQLGRKRKLEAPQPHSPNKKPRSETRITLERGFDISYDADEGCDLNTFLREIKKDVINKVREFLLSFSIKLSLIFSGIYETYNKTHNEIHTFHHYSGHPIPLHAADDVNLNTVIENLYEVLLAKHEAFEGRGSGWKLCLLPEFSSCHLEVKVAKYKPLRGNSYVKLPLWIQNKKAVINIKNNDNQCFLWCIIAAHHLPNNNRNKLYNYNKPEYLKKFEPMMAGIEYPVTLDSIDCFERQCNSKIAVNVFTYDSPNNIYTLRVSKIVDRQKVIRLLLIKNKNVYHYCLINDLPKLVARQITKHEGKIQICDCCLAIFYGRRQSPDLELQKHMVRCAKHAVATIKMPKHLDVMKFWKLKALLKHPVVLYADFESLLKLPTSTKAGPKSVHISHHTPCSFALLPVYAYPHSMTNMPKFKLYFGASAPKVFIETLIEFTKQLTKLLDLKVPMPPPTPQQEEEHNRATICEICECAFTENNWKVYHHNHWSGEVVSVSVCNKCNLQIKVLSFVPVLIHNLKGYDAHLFVKELGCDSERINIIPQTKEKYISFSKWVRVEGRKNLVEIRFLDSYQFLPSSLAGLAEQLTENELVETKRLFENKHLNLLKQKSIYPYEYMDNFGKFNELQLPPREVFCSRLTNSTCSVDDYQHAKKVFEAFGCRNMRDYHDVYLKLDTTLLADVFESHRRRCISTHGLDPAYSYTTPGWSWEAMLKSTKVKIGLISNIDHHLFIEDAIRGGIVQAPLRYIKANNKYMPNYNPNTPSTFISYIDMNNLYGWAMSQFLPIGDYMWMEEDELANREFLKWPADHSCGCFLEVDLEYPHQLHDKHHGFAMAPQMEVPPGGKNDKKLMLTFHNKQNYVLHYRLLQFYLQQGLILKRVHKALKFTQKKWLEPYISDNTQSRARATSAADKDHYKLLNNSIFGKTMEQVRNRINCDLVSNPRKCEKLIADPFYKNFTRFTDDLMLIERGKKQVTLDKPIAVGATVLELSKLAMYCFHYEVMQPHFQDRIQVAYMDTDSFVYCIRTEDLFEDYRILAEHFDFSNYSEDSLEKYKLSGIQNEMTVGKMKDEARGRIIAEFVALRAKMYCIRFVDESKEIKKAKGVGRSVVSQFDIELYKKCLFEKKQITRKEHRIVSHLHEVHTDAIDKVALDAADNKLCVLPCNEHTMEWGHHQLNTSSPACYANHTKS